MRPRPGDLEWLAPVGGYYACCCIGLLYPGYGGAIDGFGSKLTYWSREYIGLGG